MFTSSRVRLVIGLIAGLVHTVSVGKNTVTSLSLIVQGTLLEGTDEAEGQCEAQGDYSRGLIR